MIVNKSTFFLGIFVFLIPFLGIPGSWKNALVIITAIFIVLSSVKVALPKKPKKTRMRKERRTPVFVENIPVYPKDNTMEARRSKKNLTRKS